MKIKELLLAALCLLPVVGVEVAVGGDCSLQAGWNWGNPQWDPNTGVEYVSCTSKNYGAVTCTQPGGKGTPMNINILNMSYPSPHKIWSPQICLSQEACWTCFNRAMVDPEKAFQQNPKPCINSAAWQLAGPNSPTKFVNKYVCSTGACRQLYCGSGPAPVRILGVSVDSPSSNPVNCGNAYEATPINCASCVTQHLPVIPAS